MKCPRHGQWLRLDERTTDSVPDGLGPLGSERTFVLERFVCPVNDCHEQNEVTR